MTGTSAAHDSPIQLGQGLSLLIGGARSGKSDLAVSLAKAFAGEVVFAATAEAGDDDMAARIDRHKADRPSDWGLVEAPLLDASTVDTIDPSALLIIDCITLLVTNLMLADKTNQQIGQHASVLSHVLVSRRAPTIVISNEVGLGVHPETELGRRFRGVLGRYNNQMASGAETTLFIAAGQAVSLKKVALGWQ